MSAEFEPSDDPALRNALKRAFAHERAPESLRMRITELCEHTQRSSFPIRPAFWRRPIYRVAAAFFVACALAAGLLWRFTPRALADKPSPALLAAMVRTHDECCAKPTHSMKDLPTKNLHLIAKRISSKLNDPVLAADLEADGWNFVGACICNVAQNQSAHLVFRKGERQMSVFSLAAPGCNRGGKCVFREVVNGHMVAGYTQKGRAYCMVGYSPQQKLELDEVASLLEKHQDELEVGETAVAHVYSGDESPLR